MRARGTLNIDLATSDFKVINGKLDIRKFAVYNGEAMYAVDSLLFASIDQQGQSEISIRSDIIEGNFAGTINLYSLPEVLRRHFNNYFSLHEAVYKKPAQPQNFKFDLKIKNTDLITEVLVPELDPFVPGRIAGEFNSNEDRLDIRISLAKINYSGIGADSITFDATSNKDELTYALALREIKMDTMRMEALRLSGNVGHDSIRTKLTILDSLQKEKYVLGGVFHSLEKVFQFKFFENEIIMNYAPWIAPPDNALQFTSRGIRAHNFSITNINEKIALETSDHDSVVAIVFKDLNLQNITKLVEGTTPIDGLANGDFKMMTSQKGAFNSKLQIEGLEIFRQQWGNLSLVLDQNVADPLDIDLNVSGDKTNIRAHGYYESNPAAPEINFTTTISKLNLEAIEPLTMGQLKNTKGQVTGEVKIVGHPSKPDINGALNFKGAAFTPSKINSEFLLEDETISITNDNIVFDNFEIKDSKNNIAKLDGTIKTASFSTFDMNLNLTATDFQILNSTGKDNELFYGNVRITTKAKIKKLQVI
jgi:translocation and assembly module TamB